MQMAQVENWIRERAYLIWEQEGRPEGRERHHWEVAAREVLASGDGTAARAPAPAKIKRARSGEKAASARNRNGRVRMPAA